MTPQCDEMCCNHGCNQGRDCPVRKTAREDVEKLMGVWEKDLGKVGKRYPAAPPYAPSHWNKTIKLWAKVVLIVTVSSMAAGFVVGVL